MIIRAFLVINKVNQVRFSKKTFLIANISLEIVLEILFLTLSGTDINFLGQKLCWKTYTIYKAFSTIRHIKIVWKRKSL